MFSVDAHGTPEAVVSRASDEGVHLMAVTDHNTIDGFERARKRASEVGIRLLTGVEIDARWRTSSHHFLGLGFDPLHQGLRTMLERNASWYGDSFEVMLDCFADYGYTVDRGRLAAGLEERYPTHPSPRLNMWYARTVLLDDGVFPDRETYHAVVARIRDEHFARIPRGFGPLEETVDVVHDAGGLLLLAHVSQYRAADPKGQEALILEVLEAGVDGFELFHPDNMADPGFQGLLALAESRGCLVSGGSDCHDVESDGKNAIGRAGVPDWVGDHLNERLVDPTGR